MKTFVYLALFVLVACSDQRSVNAPVPQPTAAKVLALVEADTSNGAGPGRAVLVAFYEATDGANWLRSDKWISEAPLREWHGVETDDNGRVIGLHLNGNQLSGSIPFQLGQLENLRYLSFNGNQLSGSIPSECW